MKISRLIPWIIENIFGFFMAAIVIVFIGGFILMVRPDAEKQAQLPAGTEVIIKGTDIKVTVIRWLPNDEVVVGFNKKDGTPQFVHYNYNLLKKQ